MYKVVIIDDEPIIVEGLSKLLPWEQYHCKIAATACNGKEGLEVIRRERPDILFSDICMPGLDGLSMIAALKVEFPDMEISILTGFREFDYCQKAIRLGVSRFLLKPSNMAELEEALKVMTERLNKKVITGEQTAEEESLAASKLQESALENKDSKAAQSSAEKQSSSDSELSSAQGLSLSTKEKTDGNADNSAGISLNPYVMLGLTIVVSGLILIGAAALVVWYFHKNWHRWGREDDEDDE